MASTTLEKSEKNYKALIIGLSVAIPVVVGILIMLPQRLDLPAAFTGFLPTLNALLNSSTAVLLVAALVAIKRKNIALHKRLMMGAFVLGGIFLLSYVLYHASTPSTRYGDVDGDGVVSAIELAEAGTMRTVYFVVLLSHIVLAAIVLPFVLFALYFALNNKIERHKRIVKWAYPLWLYVSVTGVVVYLMISPFYH